MEQFKIEGENTSLISYDENNQFCKIQGVNDSGLQAQFQINGVMRNQSLDPERVSVPVFSSDEQKVDIALRQDEDGDGVPDAIDTKSETRARVVTKAMNRREKIAAQNKVWLFSGSFLSMAKKAMNIISDMANSGLFSISKKSKRHGDVLFEEDESEENEDPICEPSSVSKNFNDKK